MQSVLHSHSKSKKTGQKPHFENPCDTSDYVRLGTTAARVERLKILLVNGVLPEKSLNTLDFRKSGRAFAWF